MSSLALNLLLAVAWLFLWGELTVPSLLAGFIVGFSAIALTQAALGRARYLGAAGAVLRLAARFVATLVVASLVLARDVLRRAPAFDPAFVRVDVPALGPVQTVVLANLVSLTPGTLTVDAVDEGGTLYVHALYAADVGEVRREILRMARLIQTVAGGEEAP